MVYWIVKKAVGVVLSGVVKKHVYFKGIMKCTLSGCIRIKSGLLVGLGYAVHSINSVFYFTLSESPLNVVL